MGADTGWKKAPEGCVGLGKRKERNKQACLTTCVTSSTKSFHKQRRCRHGMKPQIWHPIVTPCSTFITGLLHVLLPHLFVSSSGVCIQAEAAQQAADHRAHAETQEAQLHSLRMQLTEHKQAVKQQPWTGTATATGRLHPFLPGTLTHARMCCDKKAAQSLTWRW